MSDVPVSALVLHQRSAPIDARERLLELVTPWRGLDDRIVLATCHRVEVYAAGGAVGPLGPCSEFGGALVHLSGSEAVAHLFQVAVGLDSAVQGEAQIRGQVRAALSSSPATLDPTLRRLFERALSLGRTLRRRSAMLTSRSVGSLAVDEILRLLPQPERATVLVVGAGEMGALAVRALARRVLRVVVANRDRSRGDALARSAGAEAVALADLPRTVADADAVVSAADTRGAVLTEALLAPRVAHSPLPLVDIAVPRSVGARARALSGLTYRSVDDLPGARLLSAADAEGTRAECAAEAARFSKEIAERAAAHAIRDVRAHADAVRLRQLDRALRRLGHLSPRDRRVIEALSARVMNALLHEPTIALKSAPHRSDEALALFGIGRDRS